MQIRNLAWVFGAALAVSVGGMGAMACSSGSSGSTGGSSSGSGSSSGGTGSDAAADVATGDDGGTGVDSGTPTADAGCKNPATPHPGTAGDVFCGYGADGGSLTCSTGQQCCVGGSLGGGQYAPDDCNTWGGACDNPDGGGLPVECEQPQDCTANNKSGAVCCLVAPTGGAVNSVPGCPLDFKATGGKGTSCEMGTTCAAGDVQLCGADTDCPSSAPHCVGFRWKIIQLGYCSQ